MICTSNWKSSEHTGQLGCEHNMSISTLVLRSLHRVACVMGLGFSSLARRAASRSNPLVNDCNSVRSCASNNRNIMADVANRRDCSSFNRTFRELTMELDS